MKKDVDINYVTTLEESDMKFATGQDVRKFRQKKDLSISRMIIELGKLPAQLVEGKKENYNFSYNHYHEVEVGKRKVTPRLVRGLQRLK